MKLKFLLLAVIGLLGVAFTSSAQVETDLELTAYAPLAGDTIAYGDTAIVKVLLRNLGPGDIVGDTIVIKIGDSPVSTLLVDTIAAGDSVILQILGTWNDSGEYEEFSLCLALDFTRFAGISDENTANDTACFYFVLEGEDGLSLENIRENVDCVLYPNPAKELLQVKLPDELKAQSYTISDYTGRVICRGL